MQFFKIIAIIREVLPFLIKAIKKMVDAYNKHKLRRAVDSAKKTGDPSDIERYLAGKPKRKLRDREGSPKD